MNLLFSENDYSNAINNSQVAIIIVLVVIFFTIQICLMLDCCFGCRIMTCCDKNR